LTDCPDPRETQGSATAVAADDRLLQLVRFLARAAAETDFAEHVLKPKIDVFAVPEDEQSPEERHSA